MSAIRIMIQILGFLAVLIGLLWIGQGTGYIKWPASSFMIDVRPWAWRGMILAIIGVVLLLLPRWLRR